MKLDLNSDEHRQKRKQVLMGNLPPHLRDCIDDLCAELQAACDSDPTMQELLAFPDKWRAKEHERWKPINESISKEHAEKARLRAEIRRMQSAIGVIEARIIRLQKHRNVRQGPINRNNKKILRRELALLKPLIRRRSRIYYEQYKTVINAMHRRKEGISDDHTRQKLAHFQGSIHGPGREDARGIDGPDEQGESQTGHQGSQN